MRPRGTAFAGAPYAEALKAGEAVRIMTGAPMPAGSDAVLPAEVRRLTLAGIVLFAIGLAAAGASHTSCGRCQAGGES